MLFPSLSVKEQRKHFVHFVLHEMSVCTKILNEVKFSTIFLFCRGDFSVLVHKGNISPLLEALFSFDDWHMREGS